MREIVGHVTYGARSFHQDASMAMKGDIVRALIETITNSDDAYNGDEGKIRIEVEHRHGPWTVITRDMATGMTAARMKEAIEGLGGRTSGFESGKMVRGNLGRGAKDLAAFGPVDFESIRDGQYAKMTLEPNGETHLVMDRATSETRERLKLRGNGTVVTMHVRDNIRCPRHANLKDKLALHYQLRDILSDPRRKVTLVDVNSGGEDPLRYVYPKLPQVLRRELTIPGYPEAKALLTIYRNPERYSDPASDPCRPGGILIKGRRAIYENTYFGFEANPHAGWFSGSLECKYIDQIASDYDDRFLKGLPQPANNNIPIITRSRDGLEHNHPFYRALAQAAELPLGELIKAEEERAKSASARESARTRKLLDTLGRDLARLINDDLREIDEDVLPPDRGADVPSVKIVPEHVVVYLGEDKTVSVRVRADLGINQVSVESDPAGVVELLDGPTVALVPHRRRSDLLVGQIRMRALLQDSETLLMAQAGEASDVASVETRKLEVIEVPVTPPDDLQFERESYRLTWTKKKTLTIVAPAEVVAKSGDALRVTSSNAGIVVLGGHTRMALDEELDYYSATVTVEARVLDARGTLRAELGSAVATANAVVGREEEGASLRIEFADEEAGIWRAQVATKEGKTVMRIMGRHPTISRYLGPGPEFPYQERPLTQAIVAEIAAAEATRMVMERKYPLGKELDAPAMYADHMKYMKKYLSTCHRALVQASDGAGP